MAGVTYQEQLLTDRYAQAALSVNIKGALLQQPYLSSCAYHLLALDVKRIEEKGRPMSADHLKQEAVKWARAR